MDPDGSIYSLSGFEVLPPGTWSYGANWTWVGAVTNGDFTGSFIPFGS
jgi:hypothetical protein